MVLTLAGCAAPYPHTQWDRWTAASTPVTPGATWSKYASPEQAAWSSAGLADAEAFSRRIGSAAVMVVFDGAVLAHWGEIERRFNVHSVRKSLLSALYGIAAARGEIDLDQSLADLGIDDRRPLSEIEKSARVVDLLSARSGFYLPAAYESPSMRSERPRRGTVRPGERWYYDNWDFNALGTIYRERTGRDLFEAFAEDLARPIQMQDFAPRHGYQHLEPQHSVHPAYPLRMSARDLARFGLLFLPQGRWRDRAIVPRAQVARSVLSHSRTGGAGYGYMWWVRGGRFGELETFNASGLGGQRIYVIPRAKRVIIHRANTFGGRHVDADGIQALVDRILRARTGVPRVEPELVAMPSTEKEQDAGAIDPHRRRMLSGRYGARSLVVEVRELGQGLEIVSPAHGRFALLAEDDLRFLAEDARVPVRFERAPDGAVKAMIVRFPNRELRLRRLP